MTGFHQFSDRSDAGRQLAECLVRAGIERPLVLAVPRGGVPVGVEIAAKLSADFDLLFVRKIGAPQNREVAIGAIAGCGQPQTVINSGLLAESGASSAYVDAEVESQMAEIERQRRTYLSGKAALSPEGRNVVVADDGVATGATLAAGLKGLRLQGARSITLAIPVAPPEAIRTLKASADRIVCLLQPSDFRAVGLYYRDFSQVSDAEVIAAIARSKEA